MFADTSGFRNSGWNNLCSERVEASPPTSSAELGLNWEPHA